MGPIQIQAMNKARAIELNRRKTFFFFLVHSEQLGDGMPLGGG
jgi:hypothetical protein